MTTTPIATGRRVVTHDQPHRASYGWCNARHGQVQAVEDGVADLVMDCGHTVHMPVDQLEPAVYVPLQLGEEVQVVSTVEHYGQFGRCRCPRGTVVREARGSVPAAVRMGCCGTRVEVQPWEVSQVTRAQRALCTELAGKVWTVRTEEGWMYTLAAPDHRLWAWVARAWRDGAVEAAVSGESPEVIWQLAGQTSDPSGAWRAAEVLADAVAAAAAPDSPAELAG